VPRRGRVVVMIFWISVRGKKAPMNLCVAAGKGERGDVVCARAFVPLLLLRLGHDELREQADGRRTV
jgi:hypothetical protein